MPRFIISGLPRSGTTWLSVFLTTDDCVCLHDPLVFYSKEWLNSWEGGISDSGLWIDSEWCRNNTDKFILIDRNVEEVNASLADKGIIKVVDYFANRFHDTICDKRIFFEDLFTEELAEDLWKYIYPEKSFNRIRWFELKNIYMEPTEEIMLLAKGVE